MTKVKDREIVCECICALFANYYVDVSESQQYSSCDLT